ncbi:MAG: hypothetical protein KBD21_03780 [Candidatus Pacebacteria bacterium]|nr:hypothetical protein [Candidatus Paceibacterota bacterium]
MQKNTYTVSRSILLLCAGIGVLALGRVMLSTVVANTDGGEGAPLVELYWSDNKVFRNTASEESTTIVAYTLHNDTDMDRLYGIEGVVESVQGTTTRVFVREEYLLAGDTRLLEETLTTALVTEEGAILRVTLRDPHQSIYTRIPAPQ